MSIPKWTSEREETLKSAVGGESPVSTSTVETVAATLETTTRSIAAKLRKMGYEVASMAKDHSKSYTEAEEAELRNFVEANAGRYTYGEIASQVLGGNRSAKQIQGKILSMELTDMVKPTPQPEVVKKYTEAEEEKLLGLLSKGGFIEDIADAMGRPVNSVRGKILSLSRNNPDITIPKQKTYKSKESVDPIEALGDLSGLTVEDIADSIDKTVRGVKTMLTHRKLTCKNYDGAKRAEKIAASAN